jgi:hypothetical protein
VPAHHVELAEHGFDVGLLARGEAGLYAAAREIEALISRLRCSAAGA